MSPRARAAAVAALAGAVAASAGAASLPLPNLVQEPPSGLVVRSVTGEWHLGFLSKVDNLGTAALVVTATRARRGVPTMAAHQVVGGRRAGRVGTLRYVTDPTHSHWHLLPFELYELRRLPDGALVGTARKTGFCLNDSNRLVEGARRGFPARCGIEKPGLLRLREGISPGWADVYPPDREGQFVDVSDVPTGRYAVVNRVNVGRKIRESVYGDNVAATIFDLTVDGGRPEISVAGVCLGSARCAAAGIR